MTKLFLDDLRNPPDSSYIVVRSFEVFKEYISTHEMPDLISFDHDLGPEETGMDCAKWMVEEGYLIKNYIVHSANPVGRKNIEGLLDNWIAFNSDIGEDYEGIRG